MKQKIVIPEGYQLVYDVNNLYNHELEFKKIPPTKMNIPKYSNTITGALRQTLDELGISIKNKHIFSDPRKNKTAVSVKIMGYFPNKSIQKKIIKSMGEKGHKLLYTYEPEEKNNWGRRNYFKGIRFCFEK